MEKALNEAAGRGVRLQKTRSGYLVQGARKEIDLFQRRLR